MRTSASKSERIAVADGTASQAFGLGPAKNAKDVVLGAGKPCRFQELFRFLAECVGGLQEGNENAVLQREGRVGGFGAQVHGVRIVVTTTIVKREMSGLGASRSA